MAQDLELRTKNSTYIRIGDVWRKNDKEIGPACYVSEAILEQFRQKIQDRTNRKVDIDPGYRVRLIQAANSHEFNDKGGRVVYINTKRNTEGELWESDPIIYKGKPGEKSTEKSEELGPDDFEVKLS
ncbi:MAG: hypothetical protein Q8N99_04730 [Nanoarchaeota archaeon]|nr:hypothetical protein [Nanoarchaeota archaeon]